jgi:Flp pilus assembly pilin Flp
MEHDPMNSDRLNSDRLTWGRFRQRFAMMARDEDGVMMTEYVILLSAMVVAFIWLNKTADAVLFGASPYSVFNNPAKIEALDEDFTGTRLEMEINYITGGAGKAESEHADRAYLSQLYRSISRP